MSVSEIPKSQEKTFVFRTVGSVPPEGIYFGFKILDQVGDIVEQLGARRVLIIASPSMIRTDKVRAVQELLSKKSITSVVFADLKPDPDLETAEKAYAFYTKEKPDLIIGIGGGSSMDLSKAVATLATNPQTPYDMMTTKNINKPSLSLILIPSTAGTGSDISNMFLLADGPRKLMVVSPYVFAKVALIDPEMVSTTSDFVAAASGMDALSHAIEAVMSKNGNDFYDSIALGGIRLISQYLPSMCSENRTLTDCYYVSLGSTMAMFAFNGVGGLYAHSLAHILNLFIPTPHGVGCGISLPYTMAFNLKERCGKLASIASSLGVSSENTFDEEVIAKLGIERVYNLQKGLGLGWNLKDMDFNYDDLEEMARLCIEYYPRPNNPRPMSVNDCYTLLKDMWVGEVKYRD